MDVYFSLHTVIKGEELFSRLDGRKVSSFRKLWRIGLNRQRI